MPPVKKTGLALNKIDLDKLSPKVRRRIERALNPSDTQVSQRFPHAKVAAWKAAAKRDGESMRDWMERVMDAAARK
jgi:hypothetical protein